VVWLEPDVRYMQNLLERAEMTKTTTDIVLFLDHFSYCGCFIRFAPTPASRAFYDTVMRRLQSRGSSTNDQIVLNELVVEQRANYTVLDRCLYRSGTYYYYKTNAEYQRACSGVLPVVQHYNWIVGARAKVQLAKAHGGWYLSDDEGSCLHGGGP
jgi:hypothetical protein